MEKLIVNIHSFVDVITNSSTELFVCNTDKSLKMVRELVKQKESKFPNEYGHILSVNYCDDYELQEAFGYFDEEPAIKYLKAKGYVVEKPKSTSSPVYISISAERGGMDPRLKVWIEKTFNVIHYTFES